MIACRVLTAVFALVLSVAPAWSARLKVVASFSILAEFAARIGGQLDHADWIGLNFWDLIQPFFMFIVGVSMPFSLKKPVLRFCREIRSSQQITETVRVR